MSGGVLALAFAGLLAFLVGAYIAANGERPLGIAFMGMGLVFQALTLRQLKLARKAESEEKGSSDARG